MIDRQGKFPTWKIISSDDKPGPSVSLVAVGDMMFCREVGEQVRAHGADFPFELVRPLLTQGDLVVGNLETPIAGPRPGIEVPPHGGFRSEPECAAALRQAGFNILSRANNHALDCGRVGVEETTEWLKQADILWGGVGESREVATRPVILTVNGLKLGFLFRTWAPKYARRKGGQQVALLSRREILRAVTALRQQVDCCIVSLHFGQELVSYPMPEEARLAREIIAHGADLLLGHHPHVLQGIERFDKGLIVYSLGNFVFHKRTGPEGESAILRCRLASHEVLAAELIPLEINADFRPELLAGPRAEELLQRVRALSEKLGTPEADRLFWEQAGSAFVKKQKTGLRRQLPRFGWRYIVRRLRMTNWMHVRLACYVLRRKLRKLIG